MQKQRNIVLHLTAYNMLFGAAAVSFMLPVGLQTGLAVQVPPPTLELTGVVRDFSSTHPDFGVTNVAFMGHYVGTVASILGPDGNPLFVGPGQQVAVEWRDKFGNPIAPYAGPGLPGGHFDVDVYDGPDSLVEHEHQFDDTNDVTYFLVHHQVGGNPASTIDAIIPPSYPNDIRVEFNNVHNGGGGTFTFQAGNAPPVSGLTADGFTTVFDPNFAGGIGELRVNFVALAALRQTEPGMPQGDFIDRDDSFYIRMYDTVTNAIVYEVVVYNHFQDDNGDGINDDSVVEVQLGNDACGSPITDVAGSYGMVGTGAVTDSTSFGQWFRDELGINQSTYHTISLQRDAMGVYEYMTNSFFPVDGRLMGNEGYANNNYFTYAITAVFTYQTCAGQFFEFESNDDAWVFMDSTLVVDLSGTATPERQYVALDRLGLVDGQTYTFDFFFAHRRDTLDSVFRMRTNVELTTNGVLPLITSFYD